MQNLSQILEKTFVADLEHHPVIGSTNDRAMECAAIAGVKLPFLVLADRQTAGRGRGANRWWTGPGSLAFSLLMGPVQARPAGAAGERMFDAARRPPPLVSLAAGVAVVEAMAPLVSGHEIGLHWPNDVMLDGRKLAGILIEVLANGRLVIGIGINSNNTAADAPPEVRLRVVTLRDATGQPHDQMEILIAILCQLQRLLAELGLSAGSLARRAHELCLQRGQRWQVVQGNTRMEGYCLGIADDGALLLDIDGQPRAFYSGLLSPA